MSISELQFLKNRLVTSEQKAILVGLLFCLFNLNAQVALRIEPGVLLETNSENLGLLLNIEPKLKFSKNSVIGLRFAIAANPQNFKINDSSQYFIEDLDDNGFISFVLAYDYYLNSIKYRPFLGIGSGYYLFNYTDVKPRNGSREILEGSVNNQLGLLLRGGFELGKIRLGLEYNLVPKSEIQIPNGEMIGTVDNSYLGLSIGFTIGGEKSSI